MSFSLPPSQHTSNGYPLWSGSSAIFSHHRSWKRCVIPAPIAITVILGQAKLMGIFHVHLPTFQMHTLQGELGKTESNCPLLWFGHRRNISDHKKQVGTSKSHIFCGLYNINSLVNLHRPFPETSEFLNIIEIFSTLKLTMKIMNKKRLMLSLKHSSPKLSAFYEGYFSRNFIFQFYNVVCTLYEISYQFLLYLEQCHCVLSE